jgi:hypothetical protein
MFDVHLFFLFFSPSGARPYFRQNWIIFSATYSGVKGSVSISRNPGQSDFSTISEMDMAFLDGFKKRFDSYLPVYYIPFNEYIEAI